MERYGYFKLICFFSNDEQARRFSDLMDHINTLTPDDKHPELTKLGFYPFEDTEKCFQLEHNRLAGSICEVYIKKRAFTLIPRGLFKKLDNYGAGSIIYCHYDEYDAVFSNAVYLDGKKVSRKAELVSHVEKASFPENLLISYYMDLSKPYAAIIAELDSLDIFLFDEPLLHYLIKSQLNDECAYDRPFLKRKDWNPQLKDSDGRSYLHTAMLNLISQEMFAWLAENIDINTVDTEQKTALHLWCEHFATYNENDENDYTSYLSQKTKLLLDKGIKLNQQDCEGMTALHYACAHEFFRNSGKEEFRLCQKLIAAGADINSVSSYGSPLFLAEQHNPELVTVLKERGASSVSGKNYNKTEHP